ncbi:hypothetical protein [Phycicoccus flavus]|uniref:GGDEF domain-containing protein n=1 Tax=Phycicoccus flavus TaxID=2502783 RepID=A0A8T6R4V1_9MICO|nr:hypothetical protein [Phycicoccus flavus]NHA68490.1 hypothetical protein [Phycicoccus flavus]
MDAVSTERTWRASHAAAHLVATAALVLALGVLAGRDTHRVALVVAVVTLLVGAGAAVLDGLLGIVVGLVGAVVVVLAHRWWGGWDVVHVVEVLLVVGLGWSSGLTGAFVRRTARHLSTPPHGAVAPSLHTLGLLDAATARMRIDEELARRAVADRPLSVVLLHVEHLGEEPGEAPGEERRRRVTKALARALEASTRPADVPFALTDEVLGVVLPDTAESHAWHVLGRVVEDALGTGFADREAGTRRRLGEVVALHSVLVAADDSTRTADHLLGRGRARAEAQARGAAA